MASNRMIHYLKLVRPVNLVVLALTMILFRYCIIDVEIYKFFDFKPYMSDWSFYILLFTTLVIAAGGYVINDIFDVDTDQVNRPEKMLIDTQIESSSAFTFYKILSAMGVIGSIALMVTTKEIKVSMLPIFVLVVLYLYASTIKKIFLLGNVVIAMCTALPIVILSFYELRINPLDTATVILFTQGIGLSALLYSIFAFLTTLIREIIKDIQDIEGDDVADIKTFPVLAGILPAKVLVFLIQLITLAPLLLIAYYFLVFSLPRQFYAVIFMLILPLLVQIGLVIWAKTSPQFKWPSLVGKIHMLLGVLTLLYFSNGTAPHEFNKMFNFFAQVLHWF
ncbi:MAG: geranylgeranylglycerol-phosphate geranylgeranyltransferase [Chitinophagales bacterium]|nr:geranylgeranylglycerol-phosphate geranylgeranyltransferase [Chitinophagales bacterium]